LTQLLAKMLLGTLQSYTSVASFSCTDLPTHRLLTFISSPSSDLPDYWHSSHLQAWSPPPALVYG